MSSLLPNTLRSLISRFPGVASSNFTFVLPPQSIAVSVDPLQVSWWCSGRLNKTSKLARKKARRRAGERVSLRYR